VPVRTSLAWTTRKKVVWLARVVVEQVDEKVCGQEQTVWFGVRVF